MSEHTEGEMLENSMTLVTAGAVLGLVGMGGWMTAGAVAAVYYLREKYTPMMAALLVHETRARYGMHIPAPPPVMASKGWRTITPQIDDRNDPVHVPYMPVAPVKPYRPVEETWSEVADTVGYDDDLEDGSRLIEYTLANGETISVPGPQEHVN
jgi:hypothetical protein